MEAEMVLKLGLHDRIDKGYYNKLVDDAVDTISKYGDFEQFVSSYDTNGIEDLPFENAMNEPEAQ